MPQVQKKQVLLPHRLLGNIYVRELGDAYKEAGCEVIFGPENFFESNIIPSIVHVQWPEELYRAYGNGGTDVKVKRLFSRVDALRQAGCRIALTIHNEQPHEKLPGNVDAEVYQYLFDNADIVHHHCECSIERIAARYSVPDSLKQFVAPHGHYFSYSNTVSIEEARKSLGLPVDAFVYLHFGAIRDYKGIDMVLEAFQRVRKKNDILLVAGRMPGTGSPLARIKFAYFKNFAPRIKFHLRMIDDDDIQNYVNAANALVLGHSHGLNSGVAVLGMSFGRPVIGPRLGCIPSVLDQGENLIYPTGDLSSLVTQMANVKAISAEDASEKNRKAASEWHWAGIAQPVLEYLMNNERKIDTVP